jgi:hypothetical protein
MLEGCPGGDRAAKSQLRFTLPVESIDVVRARSDHQSIGGRSFFPVAAHRQIKSFAHLNLQFEDFGVSLGILVRSRACALSRICFFYSRFPRDARRRYSTAVHLSITTSNPAALAKSAAPS